MNDPRCLYSFILYQSIDIDGRTIYHVFVVSLKEEIRNDALGLGFSACGFAGAEYDPLIHRRFNHWLDGHYQADMKYLEHDSRMRSDPRGHIPQAKSVIVCTLNYYSDPKCNPAGGYISIYSRGENYHAVVGDKLKDLSAMIGKRAEKAAMKSYVDTSPLAEKSYAIKAGLGFVGKNDLFILFDNKRRKSQGSFHFIGAIVTDIEIEPDPPQGERCGRCRKCIDACPTHAILDDRLIDANKCIAYHTLENEGEIPPEIGIAMGNIIHGCDICQLACPFNKHLAMATEPRFLPDPLLVDVDIAFMMNISENEFKRRFGRSSVGERDYKLFRRNISIAAANLGYRK